MWAIKMFSDREGGVKNSKETVISVTFVVTILRYIFVSVGYNAEAGRLCDGHSRHSSRAMQLHEVCILSIHDWGQVLGPLESIQ